MAKDSTPSVPLACPLPPDIARRFWSKVDRSGECWVWLAGTNNGYGRFAFYANKHRRQHKYAHIVAWEERFGPVPDGLELDHKCRNRRCVNPDHLEPVTHQVNVERGIAGPLLKARHASVTHCPHGHEYTPENTRTKPNGCRVCRQCARDYFHRAKAARKHRQPPAGVLDAAQE